MANVVNSNEQRDFRCTYCGGKILIPRNLPSTSAPCPHCTAIITSPDIEVPLTSVAENSAAQALTPASIVEAPSLNSRVAAPGPAPVPILESPTSVPVKMDRKSKPIPFSPPSSPTAGSFSVMTRLLKLLHRNPILSTGILLIIGMSMIFSIMVFLSKKMNEELSEQFAANYIHSLNQVQADYSNKVVSRVKSHGINTASDYHAEEGSIPTPTTFSIELAQALTDPTTGVTTRIYSDYPFTTRKDGGPRDEFETAALIKLRFADDKTKPYVRYETVGGRYSLRYAQAMVMQQSCVDCHNSHPESPKKDWKVGDTRGVRAVTLPLDASNKVAHRGWVITLAVMLALAVTGLGLIFLVVNALRASIDMLSKTNTAFGRFVPHDFLRYLKRQSIVDVQLNDNVETQMTVLFSDIRSFTDLSEMMTPEENFKFVNGYLNVMGPVIRNNHGFIDKYIGDAIMALFDNVDDAMNAAIEMLGVLREYNIEHVKVHAKPLTIGIGLHKGKVRLGTIGEHGRMDSTVISDAVNLASRIEGLTKYFGVEFLISDAVLRSVSEPAQFLFRFIDKVKVKGKKEPVKLYEVFNADSIILQSRKRAIREDFEKATKLYAVKEFTKAKALFEKVIFEFPDDKATQSYLVRCDRYEGKNLGDHWDGSLDLDYK